MSMTDKKFQFWRVLVALAHQDHKVTQEEREFFVSKFDFIDFSEAQKAQLLNELGHPKDAMALFDSLDDKMDRAECLHMAHTLFGHDGELHPSELAMYQRLKDTHMASLNMDKIREDFEEFLKEQNTKENAFEKDLNQLRDNNDFLSGWRRFFKK